MKIDTEMATREETSTLFHAYRLHEFPPEHAELAQASGFAEKVREAFLEKLPQFSIDREVNLRTCPWCFVDVGPRATQIDHVIPKAVYLRYHLKKEKTALLDKMSEYQHDDVFNYVGWSSFLHSYLESLLNDTSNLVECCTSCNNEKRNKIYAVAKIDAADRAIGAIDSDFRKKMEWVRPIIVYLNAVPCIGKAEEDLNYVKTGPLYASPIVLRNKKATLDDLYVDAETILRGWQASTSAFPSIRPDIAEEVVGGQNIGRWRRGYSGRLCFYCLGVYHDDAFQIDHIVPQEKPMSVETNNIDKNLIPVCRRCNGTKSDAPLTIKFLIARVDERLRQGVPGIESADYFTGDPTNWRHDGSVDTIKILEEGIDTQLAVLRQQLQYSDDRGNYQLYIDWRNSIVAEQKRRNDEMQIEQGSEV
jgi:5-methylcytosine-specific restriction endonuclease McrA